MSSELIGYRAHNAILLSLIVLKNVLIVMTFWACNSLCLKRISEISASLRKLTKPHKCLDTFVSANVMLDTMQRRRAADHHTAPQRKQGGAGAQRRRALGGLR